jgi:Fe-S cluster assembly ATP-binding protein
MKFLEIKNLHVEVEGKKILNGINLELEKGKVIALMGPNGSGKTTLSNVLMGHPKYKITKGKILLNRKNISKLPVNKRAELGLFLSFQQPQEIEGVNVLKFLKQAYNSIKKKQLMTFEFQDLLDEKAELLKIDQDFLERQINRGFSGGEKKKLEILQLLTLDPKLAILDETDSGLDIDALKIVSKGIKKFMKKDKSVIIITHHQKILDYIKPDKVYILKKGQIIKEGKKSLIKEIEKKGYNSL